MDKIGSQESIFILFAGINLILLIWAIIDLLRGSFKDASNKTIWVLLVLFLPFLGSIFYLAIGRKQKI